MGGDTGSPGFSDQQLREICGGDPALLAKMLTGFVDAMAEAFARLEGAMAGGDGQQLAREAHRLRGACAMVGADRLAGLCLELEEHALRTDLMLAAELLARLHSEWDAVEPEVRRLLGEARQADHP
jgi:HPt (histidine-containing phosphotransfer) domain-containing protein